MVVMVAFYGDLTKILKNKSGAFYVHYQPLKYGNDPTSIFVKCVTERHRVIVMPDLLVIRIKNQQKTYHFDE